MKYSPPKNFAIWDEDLIYFLNLSDQKKWQTIINLIDPDGFSVQHFYLEVIKSEFKDSTNKSIITQIRRIIIIKLINKNDNNN